jgi:hypothetical protein
MRPMDVVHSLGDVWRAWSRGGVAARVPVLAELTAPRRV